MKQTLRLVLTFCLLAFIAGDAAAQRIVRKSFARAERQTALLDSLLTSPDLFPGFVEYGRNDQDQFGEGLDQRILPGKYLVSL